jgi:hypothetical protein
MAAKAVAPVEPELHRISVVAKRLDCSHRQVLRLIEAGELEAVNLGVDPDSERPAFRVSERVIRRFIAERKFNKPHTNGA